MSLIKRADSSNLVSLTKSAPSNLVSFTNHFRPHRGEAVARLRSNAFGLFSVFLSTWLLPVPSPLTAFYSLTSTKGSNLESSNEWSIRKVVCIIEVALIAMFAYNTLEAFYALKYPRKPLPPAVTSPIKKPGPIAGVLSPASAKKPFSIISPSSTPTSKAKIFSYSPGQSLALSQSQSRQYPLSPVSTPSRVIRYSMPSKGGSSAEIATNVSISSSTSTMPPTPSPSATLASSYRGMHNSVNGGRPMDGIFLSQMAPDDDDDVEEEE